MKVFDPTIMRLNCLVLLLGVFEWVCSYPVATLNEKNQEISWGAWLLVDDHHQDPQVHDEQSTKRRITPKSVFTFPSFAPDKLPPCAEGYQSDANGRCIKIIKLDEDKQLDFLLTKLNEKLGTSLDYESMSYIDRTESGPTKLDIPFSLDVEDDYSNDTPEEELDMALIITPTRKETDKAKADDSSKLGKRDDNMNEDALEVELKDVVKLPTTIKYYENVDPTVEISTEPTTISGNEQTEEADTTTVTPTTVETTTTLNEDYTASTIADTTTTDIPTTTDLQETTTSTIKATTITTTTPRITTYHPIATTYHPYFDLDVPRTRNFVKFPQEEVSVPRSYPNGNYVRFPDADSKYQQESLTHHTRDVDEQSGNFFNEIVTPQPSQRVQELILPPKRDTPNYFKGSFYPKFFPSNDDPSSGSFFKYQATTTERRPLKKSREKQQGGFFPWTQPWATEEHPKAIVLRSLPKDDLTYLFGYKNGHTIHR